MTYHHTTDRTFNDIVSLGAYDKHTALHMYVHKHTLQALANIARGKNYQGDKIHNPLAYMTATRDNATKAFNKLWEEL